MPRLQQGAGDGLAVQIEDAAAHDHGLALAVEIDIGATLVARRIGHIKRPKHGIFSRSVGTVVVDRVHQHRHAEYVGKQDEFLPPFIAALAGPGQEFNCPEPFVIRQTQLFYGRVKMFHHDGDDFTQARISFRRRAGVDDFRRVRLGEKRQLALRNILLDQVHISSSSPICSWDLACKGFGDPNPFSEVLESKAAHRL